MVKTCFGVSMGKSVLNEAIFQDRVSRHFLGDVRRNLHFELYDVSESDEVEALALVLEFPEHSDQGAKRHVFRVDRQSLECLVDSLSETLGRDEADFQEVASIVM